MASNGIRDRVAIVGMGCTKFAEHWDKSASDLLVDATKEATASAGIELKMVDAFWLGKIAPEHVDAIEELLQRGLLHPPVFVPEFLGREDARKRIERLREGAPFEQLMAME